MLPVWLVPWAGMVCAGPGAGMTILIFYFAKLLFIAVFLSNVSKKIPQMGDFLFLFLILGKTVIH